MWMLVSQVSGFSWVHSEWKKKPKQKQKPKQNKTQTMSWAGQSNGGLHTTGKIQSLNVLKLTETNP